MEKVSEPGLPRAYQQWQKHLGRIGWVALGSVLERSKPGMGGPRYQWTRRVEGKTVTVALSAEQFSWLRKAIANQRKAWSILEKMQQLTLDHMWKNIPGTIRRKPLSKKTLGVSKYLN